MSKKGGIYRNNESNGPKQEGEWSIAAIIAFFPLDSNDPVVECNDPRAIGPPDPIAV